MSKIPNTQCNGDANDGPLLWSYPSTGPMEYEFGLVSDDRDPLNIEYYACKRYANSSSWQMVNLRTGVPGNPLDLPCRYQGAYAPNVDPHMKLAGMIDEHEFIHVSGNQHQSPRQYIKTTVPGDITTFVDASSLIDNTGTGIDTGGGTAGSGGYSYNKFLIDRHKNRYWYFLQTDRPTNPRVLGRDALLMWLPYDPDADDWATEWEFAPGTLNGEIQTCNEVLSDGDPERTYNTGAMFHRDTNKLGWFGVWQDVHDDANTRGYLFYVEREYGSNQWKTITGTNVTVPFTRAGVQAAGAQLPDQLFPIQSDFTPAFDVNGFPHIQVSDGGPFGPAIHREHYWDGAAWQYSSTPGGGTGSGHIALLGDDLYRTRTANGKYQIYKYGVPNLADRYTLSDTVDNSFGPMPDPVRMNRDVYAVMSPRGMRPFTFEFDPAVRQPAV